MIKASDIRAERARQRMTQQELSDKSGVGLTTIIRMESEKHGTGKAYFANVMAVAKVLGLIRGDK
jgi:transcriptional regulator with XRE-family HTH domain